MYFVLLKDSSHRIIAANKAFVSRVLKIVFLNIVPDSFDRLWPRKLGLSQFSASSQILTMYTHLDFTIKKSRQRRREEKRFLIDQYSSSAPLEIRCRFRRNLKTHMKPTTAINFFIIACLGAIKITVIFCFHFFRSLFLR
jgi:hypothetical protein